MSSEPIATPPEPAATPLAGTDRTNARRPIEKLSVDEIRLRFLRDNEACSAQMLGRLRRDSRQGVRALAEQLDRRRTRDRAESRRMDSLLTFEREHWSRGISRIAGVDEVGMGPLAGPVVSAAVILPPEIRIEDVNDSKQLSPEVREILAKRILQCASAFAYGMASVEEIGEINIRQAGLLSMRRALDGLNPEPELVVIDAHELAGLPWPQEARIKADATIHCVAAASVIAKVYRDRLMDDLARIYPEYGFDRHKGYGTPEHVAALKKHGPSAVHRQSFHWGGQQLDLFGSPS